MRNQLALIALATQATALAVPSTSQKDRLIVGGQPVQIEDFPYQVDLRVSDRANCGGTIISDRYVLTAAHCTEGYRGLNIRVGNTINGQGTNYNVSRAYVHPKYKRSGYAYDAAVLEITPPIKFGNTVKAIPLADSEPAVGTDTVVSGWGSLSGTEDNYPKNLYAVHVPIYDHNTCTNDYKSRIPITKDMICAGYPDGGKDSCSGDSGGPLVANGKVVGIVSFGIGCADPDYPGVYSSVASAEIRSFIKEKTGL
ncbi:hypothetical protein V2A60_010448 [Cordyceps javanica]|uniref:Trypsin-like serine protease n=1 Tax=Cordyceps javanica TaxID=43265 RepID=A0A545ULW1_9HYPO|nr:trypsin-like serine protease [Cordyceps javanica]TQW01927.1 trypsin-like serine protease [Cordyceps javanica]